MDNLVIDLYNKNCIKFGKFTLKNGTTSPIYIDLKNIITYPYLVNLISGFFINKIKNIETNYICGVPYGGIPVASVISNKTNIPMIMVRKEIKTYGIKRSIEGEYESGKTCILIEDTITTGGSINKFINLLWSEGIIVKNVFVICDRRDNTIVPNLGYKIDSLFDISFVFKTLKKHSFIKFNDLNMNYLKNFIFKKYSNFIDFETKKKSLKTHDKTSSALISIILKKQTNICFSMCIQEEIEIEDIVKTLGKIGRHICILKINSDNIKGIKNNTGYKTALLKMANEMEFMIYDDQKITNPVNLSNLWCNLYSIFGLSDLKNTLNDFKSKEKIQGVHDYKGFSISNFTELGEEPVNNVILYEGENIVNIKKNKNTSLFLSDLINMENFNYEMLESLIEKYLIDLDFDLISITKNIVEGDDLEKTILLCKSLSWNIYKKKIQ